MYSDWQVRLWACLFILAFLFGGPWGGEKVLRMAYRAMPPEPLPEPETSVGWVPSRESVNQFRSPVDTPSPALPLADEAAPTTQTIPTGKRRLSL